ncbi:39S ribosomal protein L27, mitochondrial [Galemys pyrenaicus]|uniref:39S ribosomal protein L27, mitochondrial n=1 Tax=Galemys pyrenaicus TaxID=202257 RepID=A0A8J6AAY3_GALPY|nr:39S ribosomal protein L27, mitochondrial [Galemys pyrenaicus]
MPPPATALAIRYAPRKTGGNSKNTGGKLRSKHYGIQKMEGRYILAGNIVETQHHYHWYPGARVRLRKCLYALEEGVVRYTKEVSVPNPHSLEAVELVTKLLKGVLLYQTFVQWSLPCLGTSL